MWEEIERTNLTNDRQKKINTMTGDKEFNDNEAPKMTDEEEKYVEESIGAREDIADDETKELEIKKYRLKFMA